MIMMIIIITIIDLEKVFLKLLLRGLQHFGSGIKRYTVILSTLKRTISIHWVKKEENQWFLGFCTTCSINYYKRKTREKRNWVGRIMHLCYNVNRGMFVGARCSLLQAHITHSQALLF